MSRFWLSTTILALLVWFSPGVAPAQWASQTVSLEPGWNAVYLEVQPEPDDPGSVFAGIPVEAAWAWNRRFTSVEYIQDPSTLVPEQPEWLHYFPVGSGQEQVTDLFSIGGGKAYLVKLGGTQPVDWTVVGKPVLRPTDWISDSFNLVGFALDPGGAVTMNGYFSGSSAHTPLEVYGLDALGHWVQVAGTAVIEPGKAYWVRCRGASAYPGPFEVRAEQGGAVDFGKVLVEQTLTIRNPSGLAKTIWITPQASAPAPGSGPLPVAGDVPLQYRDVASQQWALLSGPVAIDVPAGAEVGVRLAVRRTAMAAGSGLYQSLLSVSDGQGVRRVVPVLSRGIEGADPAPGGAAAVDPLAGLWVGTALVDRVNQPADVGDPDTPKPTASPFELRLLVHVDGAGQARLLREALIGWKDGVADPQTGEVIAKGRYVILTRDDPGLTAQFSGATLRDGIPVGRRITSAAFAFRDPVAMGGSLGSSVSCSLTTPYDDPLNPFVHRYHPEHDNLGLDFQTPLGLGVESYEIRRDLTLTASASDPLGLSLPGWGDSEIGGAYEESISGVHRNTLHLAGTYRLRRVVLAPTLNDGL